MFYYYYMVGYLPTRQTNASRHEMNSADSTITDIEQGDIDETEDSIAENNEDVADFETSSSDILEPKVETVTHSGVTQEDSPFENASNKQSEEYDAYIFNYWNESTRIVDAVKDIEDQLKTSFCKHNIKKEYQEYVICEAKMMQDNDIHVKIKLRKKMRAVALSMQREYKESKTAEISSVNVEFN